MRLLSIVLLLFASAPVLAQEPAPTAAPGPTALDEYVALALDSNLDVAQQRYVTEQAAARLTGSRRAYLPSLQFDARFSRAEGGRSFEIPTGDLMNPVYQALNGLLTDTGQGAPFPTIENQRIDFLRDQEQETRFRMTQVLWNPAIGRDMDAGRYSLAAEEAGLDATRRRVARDVRIAYYTYVNAARSVAIYDAAVALVEENERAAGGLWEAALVTRDHLHRAAAERLEVVQQRNQARTDARLAAAYLNHLLDRAPSAEVQVDDRDLQLPEEVVHRIGQQASSGGRLGVVEGSSGRVGLVGDANAEAGVDDWIATLVTVAIEARPELRQLGAAVQAANAGVAAVRASTLPSLALAVDAGIQGREYGIASDDRFVMGSLVLSWNVTNGGAERARARVARAERDRVEIQQAQALSAIRLEVESAARNAWVALENLAPSRERVLEAESAFRFVTRRQEEGLATGLEFLDARAALTRAQLTRSMTETEALIRLAELEFAVGPEALSAGVNMEDDDR